MSITCLMHRLRFFSAFAVVLLCASVAYGDASSPSSTAGNLNTTTPGATDPGQVVRPIDPNLASDDSTNSTLKKPTLPCKATASGTVLTAGRQEPCSVGLNGSMYVRGGGPDTFTCGADNIGATLTQLTGCAGAGSGLKYYITSVVAQSTTATGGQFVLRTGTGTNCGTGTTSILPSAATVARLSAPANTGVGLFIDFPVPIATAANVQICVLGVATNTTTIEVTGFIAP